MSAARHFLSRVSDKDLEDDIKADVKSARDAQRELKAAGQHRLADQMSDATDAYLDELSDAKSGTWSPKHRR